MNTAPVMMFFNENTPNHKMQYTVTGEMLVKHLYTYKCRHNLIGANLMGSLWCGLTDLLPIGNVNRLK